MCLIFSTSQATTTQCEAALDQIKEELEELKTSLKNHVESDHSCSSKSNSLTGENAGPSYLYYGSRTIFKLPSFELLSCQQGFPKGEDMFSGSAAVVRYNGTDALMACGGHNTQGCYVWTQGGWQNTYNQFFRYSLTSSKLPDGCWLVTGGKANKFYEEYPNSPYFNTAQVYEESTGWKDFFPLPYGMKRHCQVTVAGTVYIIGGARDSLEPGPGRHDEEDRKQPVYTSIRNQNWTELGYQLQSPRSHHACAVLNNRIYVIGGLGEEGELSSVEIFEPANPGPWTYGPELPIAMVYGQAMVHDGVLYALAGDSREQKIRVFSLKEDAKEWSVLADIPNIGFGPSPDRRIFPPLVVQSEVLHCNK
jgi:hypothetical protein